MFRAWNALYELAYLIWYWNASCTRFETGSIGQRTSSLLGASRGAVAATARSFTGVVVSLKTSDTSWVIASCIFAFRSLKEKYMMIYLCVQLFIYLVIYFKKFICFKSFAWSRIGKKYCVVQMLSSSGQHLFIYYIELKALVLCVLHYSRASRSDLCTSHLRRFKHLIMLHPHLLCEKDSRIF